jgi:hypothetical protein
MYAWITVGITYPTFNVPDALVGNQLPLAHHRRRRGVGADAKGVEEVRDEADDRHAKRRPNRISRRGPLAQ